VASDAVRLPYRLLKPTSARADEHFPLVLVLHGSNAIGDDNQRQLGPFARAWSSPEIAAAFPAYVVVPQVGSRSADYAPDDDGLAASHSGSSLPGVLALLDELVERLPVDRSRIYVVGFSMGASAALDAVCMRPRFFAGTVAFSGIAPHRRLAGQAAATPQMLVHGTGDDENPIDPDRAWAAALAAAGGRPRLVEYQGMDHRVPPDMVESAEWRSWLFSQRRR
jgi:predicted peptidase